MLTGLRFRLNRRTLVVGQSATGRHVTATIAAGEIVKVVSDADRHGLLDVLWEGRLFNVFEIDLEARGEKLPDSSRAHG